MRRSLCGTCIALLAWCSPALPQRPSDQDVDTPIARSRQKAIEYTGSLPDYVATQVIRRYSGRYPIDTLTVRLRYLQHQEEHTLLPINGKPAQQSFESLPGTVGWGESATILIGVFDPASETVFHWQSWKTVQGRRAAAMGYEVKGPHFDLQRGQGCEWPGSVGQCRLSRGGGD